MAVVAFIHYSCTSMRASIPPVCGNTSLPLEVALRLDLEAVRQLFLLQLLCTKAAWHTDKTLFVTLMRQGKRWQS